MIVAMQELAPRVKVKIGSHLSYPVKFSELCELLAPAVEQLGIEVWYSGGSKPPRQNEQRECYPVVEARHSPRGEPAWQLVISPIPRPLRAAIHPLLLAILSERIRSWFLVERTSAWYSTDHVLRVRYIPASEQFEFDEHNAP